MVIIEHFSLITGQSTGLYKKYISSLKHLGDWRKLSSSEYSNNNSYNVNMNNGNVNNNNKNNNNRVRPFLAVNNIKGIIPLSDFFLAYKDCRKNKRRTYNQLLFELDYESKLVELYKEVNSYRYKIGKSICFCVTRPKIREVFAADFRDRIVHHIIMQRLEPLFEKDFIEDNYNCRKDKGTLYGVYRLNEKLRVITRNYKDEAWVGKFDLKGFFMSISKSKLLSLLVNYIKVNYKGDDIDLLIWLCSEVINNDPTIDCIKKSNPDLWEKLSPEKSLFTVPKDFGLPIGNLTSQIFGNFYLHEFDKWMESKFHGFYGRYVDDFYIIAKRKEDITSNVQVISNYLSSTRGVRLHPDKIYIQPARHGIKFTGYQIKMGRIYLGNYSLGNFMNIILKYNKIENPTDKEIESFISSLNSYLGFAIHTRSVGIIRRNILKLISKNWWKYIKQKDYYVYKK